MKTCFKCKESKPLSEFYKHKMMADGHLGKCKECTVEDVKSNYRGNRAHYDEYERMRSRTPERRAAALRYQKARRERYPEKNKARQAVSNAIRDGRLFREPCKFCGNPKVQAHHHDYSKEHWLDVTWACFKCHREKCHGQTVTADS